MYRAIMCLSFSFVGSLLFARLATLSYLTLP
jgi:hypothetical protein